MTLFVGTLFEDYSGRDNTSYGHRALRVIDGSESARHFQIGSLTSQRCRRGLNCLRSMTHFRDFHEFYDFFDEFHEFYENLRIRYDSFVLRNREIL